MRYFPKKLFNPNFYLFNGNDARRVYMREVSSLKSALRAGTAPLRGVRINGRKTMSAIGSNQRSILIIEESTTPGSAQFTRTPHFFPSDANPAVKRVIHALESEYDRNCPNDSSVTVAGRCRVPHLLLVSEVVNTTEPPGAIWGRRS